MTNEQREQYLNELMPNRKAVDTYNKVLKYKVPIVIGICIFSYMFYWFLETI